MMTPQLQNAIQAAQILSPKEQLQLFEILAGFLQNSPSLESQSEAFQNFTLNLLQNLQQEQPRSTSTQPFRRIPGLHTGSIEIAPDFDAPLPDEFWLGTL